MKDWLINTNGVPTFYNGDVIKVVSSDQHVMQMLYRAYMSIAHASITGVQGKSVPEISAWIQLYLRSQFVGSGVVDSDRITVSASGSSAYITFTISYTTDSGHTLTITPSTFPFSVEDGVMTSLENAEEWLGVVKGNTEYTERYFQIVTTPVKLLEIPCRPLLTSSNPLLVLESDVEAVLEEISFSITVHRGRTMYAISEGLPISSIGMLTVSATASELAGVSTIIDIVNGTLTLVVDLIGLPDDQGTAVVTGTALCTNAVTVGTDFYTTNQVDTNPVFPLRSERGTYTVELRDILYPGSYWIVYPAVK